MSAPPPLVGFPTHVVSVQIGASQIVGWETYEIHQSMTEVDAPFNMRLPFDFDAWTTCRPDSPVKVFIDDTCVLDGFIDERLIPEDDEAVEIVGRNKAGRLVQESAPSLQFGGLDMFTLIAELAQPWYPTVTFSNARNRTVIRGKGKKAQAAGEPIKLNTKKNIGTQIQPGMSRFDAIKDMCSQAGYIVWAAGDGTELIVGEPNYDQELQFGFFMPKADSTQGRRATVLGLGVRESVGDRYARIICVGSGIGTDVNYGSTVTSRYAEAKNNPATPDGTGLDFKFEKNLIIVRNVKSHQEAQELATREMGRRDVHKSAVTARAPGHGQVVAGANTTIFGPDMLALVEDERIDLKATYLITDCIYRCNPRKEGVDREGGEETLMTLVPSGSLLVS